MKLSYQKMSVMLVDSVGMITGTLTNILQPLGFYRIHTAKSAEEVLQTIASGKEIDLLISMWKLKAMSGAQLVEALRPKYKEMPMFLIVDTPDKMMKQKAEQIGVNGLLEQPLDGKKVTSAVEEALAPFIDEDEENYAAHLQAARQASARGQHGKSIESYKAALAIKHNEDTALALADALRDDGQINEAEQAYIAIIRQNTGYIRAYIGLAGLYLANQRPNDALRLLSHAKAIAEQTNEDEATQARILYMMGEAELELQRLQQALEYFDQAVEKDSDNSNMAVNIADSLVKIGSLENSERFYQKALDINPDMAHVYNRLGIAYRQQKKFAQALDLYTKAIEYSPSDENLYYNIARSMWEMDDFSGAEDFLTQALKIKPDFNEAQQLLAVVKKGIKPRSD